MLVFLDVSKSVDSLLSSLLYELVVRNRSETEASERANLDWKKRGEEKGSGAKKVDWVIWS